MGLLGLKPSVATRASDVFTCRKRCHKHMLDAMQCKLLRGLGLECSVYPELRKLHLFGCRQLETEGVRQDNCQSSYCTMPAAAGGVHNCGSVHLMLIRDCW